MICTKKKFRWVFSGLLALSPVSSLFADGEALQEQPSAEYTAWLTGPLIAPTGTVVTAGHYCIQPFFLFNALTGDYNSHWKSVSAPNFYNVSLQLLLQVGLTEFMDFQIYPTALYNTTEGESSTRFGDFPFVLDFQLLSADKYKYFPGIKLEITETFPTGQYQKLNPAKLVTGVSGLGSFSTAAALVFYKLYHLHKHHFLSVNASVEYNYYAPVHVRGFNVYGGGFGAHGKVYPGNETTAILSFEYTLTQNWALALDNVYLHKDKDRFKGDPGFLTPGVPSSVGRHSGEEFSFAPAIEYNFSEHLGLIAGSWFTAAGRNSLQFYSAIVSFVVSY
jgi:hypothetical protein